jgi:hypothetical protein
VEPDAAKIAIKTASDFINSIPAVSLYNSIRTKKSKSNPLFNKLRKFGQKVFDGKDIVLFDLLEAES